MLAVVKIGLLGSGEWHAVWRKGRGGVNLLAKGKEGYWGGGDSNQKTVYLEKRIGGRDVMGRGLG